MVSQVIGSSWIDGEELDDEERSRKVVRSGSGRETSSAARFHTQQRYGRRSSPNSASHCARRRLRRPMGV